MGKNKTLNSNIWSDTWFENLNVSEKMTWMYLLTNEKNNMLGIYEISIRKIAFETGIQNSTIEKTLAKFTKEQKIIYTDNYIILINFIKYQSYNPNMKKSAINTFNNLPSKIKDDCKILDTKDIAKGWQSLYKALGNSFGMLRKIEIEIEIESEIESEIEVKSEIEDVYKVLFKKINSEKKLSEDFKKLILTWLKYKSEKGQAYKETGMRTLIKGLLKDSNNNIEAATEMIEYSMKNNYAGIFAQNKSNKSTKSHIQHDTDF
ncbi:MAG: hypothetical protein PF487_00120 [Bacteroidales bacterium]|jgi:hypothetical protein|nr:hypothetical protein [Bacteroidales bacterium]